MNALRIELVPDLDHCIETQARMEHRKIQNELLLTEKHNPQLEEKFELLRLFLETADFGKLRAESEAQLLAGKKVAFTVFLKGGSAVATMRVK